MISDPTATPEELLGSGAAARLKSSTCRPTGPAIIWQSETCAMDAAESRDLRWRRGSARCGLRDLIGALFATGGETARCLLEAPDIEALDLVGEIEPGVPLSIARGNVVFR